MIVNPSRLYQDCPPATIQYYKLRLVDYFLLKPLGEVWDAMISSAYRSEANQVNLYQGDEARIARKAKGVSQHTLGEAVDIVPKGSMEECFQWCVDHLRPWQAILEYVGTKPECIHLSLPSERLEIVSKRLLFYNGLWRPYSGELPVVA